MKRLSLFIILFSLVCMVIYLFGYIATWDKEYAIIFLLCGIVGKLYINGEDKDDA